MLLAKTSRKEKIVFNRKEEWQFLPRLKLVGFFAKLFMKKIYVGTVKGIEVLKKSAPKAEISFRTGKYMSEKDRPRDKSYKKLVR